MNTRRRFLIGVLAAPAAGWAPAVLAQSGTAPGGYQLTLWRDGDPGERLVLRGRVTDIDSRPLAGARVHVRQADGSGSYRMDGYAGVMTTDAAGRYELRTALPGNYSSARHIHIGAEREGYRFLDTEVRFKGDPNNDLPGATLLEETRVDGEVVYIGTFDIVLER